MSIDALLSIGIVLGCLVALAATRRAPDVIMLGGATALVVLGVLTPAQLLAGFANEGLAAVAVLYVVVAGLKDTGVINWIGHNLLLQMRSLMLAQAWLMLPVAALSAFLNNTPVVAMLIPAVGDWAKRLGLPASQLLMPLSYAAIIGGTCTLVGTSTNLIVNSMLMDVGEAGLGFFDIAVFGVPCTLGVIVTTLLLAPRLLPRNTDFVQFRDTRQYVVEMVVSASSRLHGRSIEQAGLRHLPGLFLIEVERDGEVTAAVAPEQILRRGDRLIFVGAVESVADLQRFDGLEPATDEHFKLDTPRTSHILLETVIAENNPLVGRTIKEGRFRNRYNAAVLAVARNGGQLRGKIGDIRLRPGDLLLLEASQDFISQQRNAPDFLLMVPIQGSVPHKVERAGIAVTIVVAMVLAVAMAGVPMFLAALLAGGMMVGVGCVTAGSARRQVDLQVVFVIAAALAMGAALEQSGAAAAIAATALGLLGGSPAATLIGLYLVATLLSALVSNAAAAVVLFPISHAMVVDVGVDPAVAAMLLMVGCSAAFATPVGYQTNLMVYGPGGYRFGDFLRLGVPVTVVTGIIAVFVALTLL